MVKQDLTPQVVQTHLMVRVDSMEKVVTDTLSVLLLFLLQEQMVDKLTFKTLILIQTYLLLKQLQLTNSLKSLYLNLPL